MRPSIGSVGDSYDNAMAESVIGLFKTEFIRRRGPWRGPDAVEIATLEWVDWFNNRRLFEAFGDIPPAEAEASCYRTNEPSATLQWQNPASTEPGAVQPPIADMERGGCRNPTSLTPWPGCLLSIAPCHASTISSSLAPWRIRPRRSVSDCENKQFRI